MAGAGFVSPMGVCVRECAPGRRGGAGALGVCGGGGGKGAERCHLPVGDAWRPWNGQGKVTGGPRAGPGQEFLLRMEVPRTWQF